MNTPTYKTNSATPLEILVHLRACDKAFVPPLSLRVDLDKYSNKLHQRAQNFEAWAGDQLIGLVSAYISKENRSAFITNVSVSPEFSGKGIAKELMRQCAEHVNGFEIDFVDLEVNEANTAAVGLYNRLGFVKVSAEQGNLKLRYKIK